MFALTVYSYDGGIGDPDCWELCFEELCQAFAQDRAERACGHAAVVSVAVGAASVTLRGNSAALSLNGSSGMSCFCPAPSPIDLTRSGELLQNLMGLRGQQMEAI